MSFSDEDEKAPKKTDTAYVLSDEEEDFATAFEQGITISVTQTTTTTTTVVDQPAPFIIIGDKTYSESQPDKVVNVIWSAAGIDMDEVDDWIEAIRKAMQARRTFTNAGEAAEFIAEFMDDPEEESPFDTDGRNLLISSTVGIWAGEHAGFRKNNFCTRFRIGQSVRAGHNLDYKTSDKDCFDLGNGEVLLVRMQRPPKTDTLQREKQTLEALGREGLPVITILETGYVTAEGEAFPAMRMPKMKGSSKSLVRHGRRGAQLVDGYEDQLEELFPSAEERDRAVASLEHIRGLLSGSKNDCAVDDIQFLISDDGSFVINDATQCGRKHLDKNIDVINTLLGLLRGMEFSNDEDDDPSGSGNDDDEDRDGVDEYSSDEDDGKEESKRPIKTKKRAPSKSTRSKRSTDEDEASQYLREIQAQELLYTNNCLINAIADDAEIDPATDEQLVQIRSALANVGQMMIADEETIDAIRDALGIQNPIHVYNEGEDEPEEFEGTGEPLIVHNTGHLHFEPGLPPSLRK